MKKFFVAILAISLLVLQSIMLCSCNASSGGSDVEPPAEPTYYTVAFNTMGGGDLQSVQVKAGEKVIKPSLSTKQDDLYDYELVCWQNEGSEWNFELNKVTGNMTLVAIWEVVGTSKQFLP